MLKQQVAAGLCSESLNYATSRLDLEWSFLESSRFRKVKRVRQVLPVSENCFFDWHQPGYPLNVLTFLHSQHLLHVPAALRAADLQSLLCTLIHRYSDSTVCLLMNKSATAGCIESSWLFFCVSLKILDP